MIAAPDATEARYLARNSAVLEVNVHNIVPRAEIMTMLRWNSDQSDMDLYLVAPDGRATWNGLPWSDVGNRPLDDVDGYGPEYITVSATDPAGPPYVLQNGTYGVRVHLYRNDRGPSHVIRGSIFLVTGEATPQMRAMTCTFDLSEPNMANSSPSATGSDWRDVAWIEVAGAPTTPRITRITSGGRAGTDAAGMPRFVPFCPGADAMRP